MCLFHCLASTLPHSSRVSASLLSQILPTNLSTSWAILPKILRSVSVAHPPQMCPVTPLDSPPPHARLDKEVFVCLLCAHAKICENKHQPEAKVKIHHALIKVANRSSVREFRKLSQAQTPLSRFPFLLMLLSLLFLHLICTSRESAATQSLITRSCHGLTTEFLRLRTTWSRSAFT